ncbi:hypothetical protein A0H81_09458 [Grifola frondosa]|uniref:Uncharacterized protein n=1 Tax=Grifola frondosa TaxID=5627 RepID=A0A1C7M1P1_GRIFR|nr:hypothetical protein A0H81_09458 [Grifola frondosa]
MSSSTSPATSDTFQDSTPKEGHAPTEATVAQDEPAQSAVQVDAVSTSCTTTKEPIIRTERRVRWPVPHVIVHLRCDNRKFAMGRIELIKLGRSGTMQLLTELFARLYYTTGDDDEGTVILFPTGWSEHVDVKLTCCEVPES